MQPENARSCLSQNKAERWPPLAACTCLLAPVPCRDPSVCLFPNPAARPQTCGRAGALRAVGRSWGQRGGPLGTAGAGDRGASPNKALSIRLPLSPLLAQFGICAAREHKRGQTIGTGEPPGPVGPGSFVPASFLGRRSPCSSVSFVPSWRWAGERRAGQVLDARGSLGAGAVDLARESPGLPGPERHCAAPAALGLILTSSCRFCTSILRLAVIFEPNKQAAGRQILAWQKSAPVPTRLVLRGGLIRRVRKGGVR